MASDGIYDLIVLGGGSGGLNVASAAAAVGAKVALVEKYKLGGECTHTACVPSKAFLQAARLAHLARKAGDYGVNLPPPEVDFAAVMSRVRSVIDSFAGSDSGASLEAKGIDVYRGSPAFESAESLRVDDLSLKGRRFVIATGSHPAIPPIPGLKDAGYLDNTSFWDLTDQPGSLAIIGGGAVAVELGQALQRLGTRVTILERRPRLLGPEDEDAARCLQSALEGEGVAVNCGVDVLTVERSGNLRRIRYKVEGGVETYLEAEHLLVATGRLANVEGLSLETVGIEGHAKDGIKVDRHLRTTASNVWAIGDVIGRNRWTHAAEREAAVVFQNAVLKIPKSYDDSAMPRGVFTDPEVAAVGLTEAQANARGLNYRAFTAEMADVDRPRIDGDPAGFARLIADPGGKILGGVIVGPEASLVLQEVVLAMEHGLTLGDLANTVHAYPTTAGVIRKLANQFAATRLENPWVGRALRWLYGYHPGGR